MRGLLLLAFLLGACTPTVVTPDPATRLLPTGAEPQSLEWNSDRATMERDLLLTARARVGEAMVRRALASNAYIFGKFYPGMLPPPPPDAGPHWRYPDPPFTLLLHENGAWQVATAEGVRPANPEATTEIRRLLADPAFWRQPESAGPGCTDAGASLLLLRIPGRPEILRRGICGETELTERLVSFARRA